MCEFLQIQILHRTESKLKAKDKCKIISYLNLPVHILTMSVRTAINVKRYENWSPEQHMHCKDPIKIKQKSRN